MSIRDERQQEFANLWIREGCSGILNLCPRFGKIYTAINIMEKLLPETVLVAYPDLKIKSSWISDIEKRNYNDSIITFVTHRSLHKYALSEFDLVIIDEIHLLSESQMVALIEMSHRNGKILGLTGTLSKKTEIWIRRSIRLRVTATYPMSQGIYEGVIPDYEINIHTVSLDSKVIQSYKAKRTTEKKRFDNISWVIKKQKEKGKVDDQLFFFKLKLIEVLQKSIAKKNKTIEIIKEFSKERLLVFCGRVEIADDLGIPSYHSKSEEKELWKGFISGNVNHMAVIKIGNTGVTYKPLNKVIINYFDSNSENLTQKVNRCMSMEYDNPNKKAVIHIITSNEKIETDWLDKALSMFDKSKIKYL